MSFKIQFARNLPLLTSKTKVKYSICLLQTLRYYYFSQKLIKPTSDKKIFAQLLLLSLLSSPDRLKKFLEFNEIGNEFGNINNNKWLIWNNVEIFFFANLLPDNWLYNENARTFITRKKSSHSIVSFILFRSVLFWIINDMPKSTGVWTTAQKYLLKWKKFFHLLTCVH